MAKELFHGSCLQVPRRAPLCLHGGSKSGLSTSLCLVRECRKRVEFWSHGAASLVILKIVLATHRTSRHHDWTSGAGASKGRSILFCKAVFPSQSTEPRLPRPLLHTSRLLSEAGDCNCLASLFSASNWADIWQPCF